MLMFSLRAAMRAAADDYASDYGATLLLRRGAMRDAAALLMLRDMPPPCLRA